MAHGVEADRSDATCARFASSAGVSLAEMASATRIGEHSSRGARGRWTSTSSPRPSSSRASSGRTASSSATPADEALALYDRERGAPATATVPPARADPAPGDGLGHPLALSGSAAPDLRRRPCRRCALVGASRPRSGRTEPAAARRSAAVAPVGDPGAGARRSPPARPLRLPRADGRGDTQRLVVKAVEPTWIRVQIDEGRPVEETARGRHSSGVERGQAVRPHRRQCGRHRARQLNGRPLPPLGARGAVIHRLSLPALPAPGS